MAGHHFLFCTYL